MGPFALFLLGSMLLSQVWQGVFMESFIWFTLNTLVTDLPGKCIYLGSVYTLRISFKK